MANQGRPAVERRRRPWLFRLMALFASLVISLALLEGALRLFVPVTDVPYYFWDPVIGARMLPGLQGRYVGKGGIDTRYHLNRQGWNYPEDYTIEKKPRQVRVCVIGDSYIEAFQVPIENSLTLIAQHTMSQRGVPAQWYSFGQSGWGLSTYYLLLQHYVSFYHPDAVVIFLIMNDVYDSSPYLRSRSLPLNLVEVDEAGVVHLIEAPRFEPGRLRRLAYSTAICRYFFAQLGLHREDPGVQELYIRGLRVAMERGDLIAGNGLPIEELGAKSWRHTELLLGAIRDRCKEMNTPLLLAYCGNGPKMRSVYEKTDYKPISRDVDPNCLGKRIWCIGEDLFEPAARRLGIEYEDLTEPIAEEVRRTGQRYDFAGDDHYGELAHRVAGERIAERIMKMLGQGNVGAISGER
ncbi:MAG: SGNH/GDSL hydrolase family protein [Planctomycetes bacterium]|nr:SGNH/GDSL hydrolase family protein [Planctomycetota bacterium]